MNGIGPRGSRGAAGYQQDAEIVDRTARRIGAGIAMAGISVLLVAIGVAVAVLIAASRHELAEHSGARQRDGDGDAWVIDRGTVVLVLVALAASSVVVMTIVGWLAAKRAVTPLADTLRRQREFVADASHELRTPLTVLDARIQLILRRRRRGDDDADEIDAMRDDVRAMRELIDDLLLTATGGPVSGRCSPLEVAQGVAAALVPLTSERNQSVVVEAGEGAETALVALPKTMVARCLTALIDNAITHSLDGSSVRVNVTVDAPWALISVTDRGGGIVGIDPERVFERFAHGTDATAHRSFGIGLALVRDVARRVGGDATIASTGADGTTVLLRLPLA